MSRYRGADPTANRAVGQIDRELEEGADFFGSVTRDRARGVLRGLSGRLMHYSERSLTGSMHDVCVVDGGHGVHGRTRHSDGRVFRCAKCAESMDARIESALVVLDARRPA